MRCLPAHWSRTQEFAKWLARLAATDGQYETGFCHRLLPQLTLDYNIRPVQSADLSAAIELLRAAGLPTADITIERLLLVAEQDQTIIGIIGLEQFQSIGLLRSLVIDETRQSRGLGKALVDALERQAIAAGIGELWLLTIDAEHYFERLGYDRRPRSGAPGAIAGSEEFSSLCPDDAVLMRKRLAR